MDGQIQESQAALLVVAAAGQEFESRTGKKCAAPTRGDDCDVCGSGAQVYFMQSVMTRMMHAGLARGFDHWLSTLESKSKVNKTTTTRMPKRYHLLQQRRQWLICLLSLRTTLIEVAEAEMMGFWL